MRPIEAWPGFQAIFVIISRNSFSPIYARGQYIDNGQILLLAFW
jgi:hypothetical protein